MGDARSEDTTFMKRVLSHALLPQHNRLAHNFEAIQPKFLFVFPSASANVFSPVATVLSCVREVPSRIARFAPRPSIGVKACTASPSNVTLLGEFSTPGTLVGTPCVATVFTFGFASHISKAYNFWHICLFFAILVKLMPSQIIGVRTGRSWAIHRYCDGTDRGDSNCQVGCQGRR